MDDEDTDDEPEVAKGHNPIVWQQQSDRRFIRRGWALYADRFGTRAFMTGEAQARARQNQEG